MPSHHVSCDSLARIARSYVQEPSLNVELSPVLQIASMLQTSGSLFVISSRFKNKFQKQYRCMLRNVELILVALLLLLPKNYFTFISMVATLKSHGL